MTLLMFVLTMNVFVFNGLYYHQMWGTAMGTRVAPTYACIFMGFLEIAMLGAWVGTKLRMYRRYIDDGFFLWDGTREEQNIVTVSTQPLTSLLSTALKQSL